MIHHAEELFVPKGRNEYLRKLAQQDIYNRAYSISVNAA